MFICGFLVDEKKLPGLKERGVRDSKQLGAPRREELAKWLRTVADDYTILQVTAEEIDRLRTTSNLNRIEAERMAEIINTIDADVVKIDAPQRSTDKFVRLLKNMVRSEAEIIAENFADENHVEVAAASILAKSERERSVAALHKKYGDFGSGYTHDERTVSFLKGWIKDNKDFPEIVRKSWITAIAMREEKEQRKLRDF